MGRGRRTVVLTVMMAVLSLALIGPTLAAPPGGKGNTSVSCPVAGGAQVVLDPGHGGSDTGAVNTTYSLTERDLNLEIAQQAEADLEGAGYTVALTRSSNDEDPGNSERGEIANACGASVFVEIHLNGSSDPSVDYSQTYWGKKNKDLGFSQTMDGELGPLGIPNNGVGQFANGGLLQASMPSTLVEAVFLTNDNEGAQFNAGTRQGQIAAVIAQGVKDQLG